MKYIITLILGICYLSAMGSEVTDLKKKARDAFTGGDYVQAVDQYARALALAPDDSALATSLEEAKLALREDMGTVSVETIENLLKDLEEIDETRADALAREVNRLERGNKLLEARLDSRTARVKESDAYDKLRKTINELGDENDSLIQRLRSARTEAESARVRCAALEERVKVLNQEIEAWEEQAGERVGSKLQRQFEKQKARIRKLEQELKNERTDKRRVSAQLQFLRREQQQRNKARETIQDSTQELREKNKDLQRRVRRLEHELKRARDNSKQLRETGREQMPHSVRKAAPGAVNAKPEEQSDLVEELNTTLDKVDHFRGEASAEVNNSNVIEDRAKQRLERMKKEQEAASQGIDDLKTKLEALGVNE